MEEKEPLALPFNAVNEFKESMQRELETFFNDSSLNDLSINKKSSDKENSCDGEGYEDVNLSPHLNHAFLNNESSVLEDDSDDSEDVPLSYRVDHTTKPKTRTAAKRTKYNLRRRTQSQDDNIIIDDDDDEIQSESGEGRRQLNDQVETIELSDSEGDGGQQVNSGENFMSRRGNRRGTRGAKRRNGRTKTVITVPSTDIIAIDDDDDDLCSSATANNLNEINDRFMDSDMINEEINVKINWMFEGATKFKLRKFEPFAKLFQKLAQEKKVDKECIVLYKDDVKIRPEDTPETISLSVLDILSGYTVSQPVTNSSSYEKKTKSANALDVKVITDAKRNKEMLYSINKDQKMLVLFIKISEQLNCNLNDIQLWFDGEKVNMQDTPADLDLEGGECFELKLKAT